VVGGGAGVAGLAGMRAGSVHSQGQTTVPPVRTDVLKRSGDRGWWTKVQWLSSLSLFVFVRTCFVGCLSKAPLFPSRALRK